MKKLAGRARPGPLGAWMLALAALPAAAAEKCTVQALEIPVTMKGSRAVATVGINGTPVPLTVDSGAFFSFLTPAAAQQLKLKDVSMPRGMRVEGLTGEVDTRLTVVKQLDLIGGAIPDVDFIVGGNEPGAGTMGLLGRNFLAFSDVEYDLAHGAIRLAFPRGDCDEMVMAYWAGGQPVSELTLLRDDRRSKVPPIQAIVELNGQKQRALFDTGASSIVSLRAARSIGIAEADMKPDGRSYGVGLGSADTWVARFDSFQVGGEKVSNIRARVVDFPSMKEDMLLGIDFFLSHRIYISKSQRKMYFTYNGGPVFALSESAPAEAAAGPALPDADAYARRGAASASRGQAAAALADFDRAIELAPQSADYLFQRGMLHASQKQPREALADYDAALKIQPRHPEALMERAAFRAVGKDREGAVTDLDALDAQLPPQANVRWAMAELYDLLDQHDRALVQWDQWIAAHEQDVQLAHALNSRCWGRMLMNRQLDLALKDCDRAVDAEPKNAAYLDSRGWTQLRRGDTARARSDFDRALKLKADQAWSLYGRGLAQQRLGQAQAGSVDLDAARKLEPKIDEEAARWGLAAAPG